MKAPTIMIVAGEASGDTLGASLAAALKVRLPGVRLVGVGGAKMAEQGIESPFDIAQISFLGPVDAIFHMRRVYDRLDDTFALARREKPDLAVLVDSWGFMIRVARGLRDIDPAMTLVKYVGPQVWASRPGRAKELAQAVDHLLSILSFDAPFYKDLDLPVTFVGNPALTREPKGANPTRLRKAIGATKDEPILAVLPGSRPGEIHYVLPRFGEAVALLKVERPGLQVVIPVAPTVVEAVRSGVAAWPGPVHVIEDEQLKQDAMKAATVALACSGTVTTELALNGTPMVVGYRVNWPSWEVAKRQITTPWIVMLNIALQRTVVPEFVQYACTGPNLAKAVGGLLNDPEARVAQVADQNLALTAMGRGGKDPSGPAADAIAALLDAKTPA